MDRQGWTHLFQFQIPGPCSLSFFFPRKSDFKNLIKRNRKLILYVGFPCGSAGKESACNAGDLGSIPGLGRSPGEGKGYPLQHSALENFMDCTVHGVTKSWTQHDIVYSVTKEFKI